jgi:di/tricarboxylate transporter
VQLEVGNLQRQLAPTTRPRTWAAGLGSRLLGVFWRPIPLYQTLAVAAVAAVLVGFLGLRRADDHPAPAAPGTPAARWSAPGSASAPTVDFTGARPLGVDVL